MKRFDAASLRLVIGSTLLAAAIVAIPALRNGNKRGEEWKVKTVFNFQSEVVCVDKLSNVVTFDGYNIGRFDLKTGQRFKNQLVNRLSRNLIALTPDGSQIVSLQGTHLAMSDSATLAVRKRIPIRSSSDGPMNSIHFLSSKHAVLSQSGEIERCKGTGVVIDLASGKTIPFSRSILYHGPMAFAGTAAGVLQFGWLDGDKLHFETITGVIKELPLDPSDTPAKTQCPDWGYFLPTTLFDNLQNTLFASIQYEDSLNSGRVRTGSVCAWDWKSGSPKWRWQETDTQPVSMVLSPDQKSLAVGCTVALAGSYRRRVRVVILDAQTGEVKQEVRRNRGGSENWQQFAESVRRTADEITPNGYNMPSIAGLDWTDDGKSLVVAYADGELIRWRL